MLEQNYTPIQIKCLPPNSKQFKTALSEFLLLHTFSVVKLMMLRNEEFYPLEHNAM
jgi:hypothetical protein